MRVSFIGYFDISLSQVLDKSKAEIARGFNMKFYTFYADKWVYSNVHSKVSEDHMANNRSNKSKKSKKNKLVKNMGTQLKRSEEKFRMLFEKSPVGMAMVEHSTGAFIEINNSLLHYLGYTKDELMNMTFWDITPPEYTEQEEAQISDLNTHGSFGPNEKEYIRKDGTKIPIRISGFILTDTDGTEVVWGIIEDISLEKENKKAMENLAFYDPLTGLANRSLLTERFNQLRGVYKRHLKKFAVLLIDLDNFKEINDTYGHLTGDALLKEIASRLKRVTRRAEDTVARIGGDEFVVIIPEIESIKKLKATTKKLLDIVKSPLLINGIELNITASIGISIYLDHASDLEGLLRSADINMYLAKESGGDSYHLSETKLV